MGDCMPREQANYIHDVQLYCLNATNMTEQEAYNFAFHCWQLGFEKKKHIVREFAEMLKAEAIPLQDHTGKFGFVVLVSDIDQIAKEILK